jgi:hypothetical protein
MTQIRFSMLVAVALLLGCADAGPHPGAVAREIDVHRALWAAARPAAYVYEVERVCFCAPAGRGPVRVVVDGANVVSRTYTDGGEPVDSSLTAFFPAVDGLFDLLDDAVARGAVRVSVTWAPEGGLPLDAFIDYSENIADEEQGFRIVAVPAASGG